MNDKSINYRAKFNREANKRLVEGIKKYGKDNWIKVDLLKEIQDEILDIRNYALFMYTKIEMMKRRNDRNGRRI